MQTLEQAESRVKRLTEDIEQLVEDCTLGPLVKAFAALRGLRTVASTVVAAEIGDFARFARAHHLMAFVGLVPSEHSSGESRRQGRITKTGNGHVRRILIESAWSYIHPPRMSREITVVARELAGFIWAIARQPRLLAGGTGLPAIA